MANQEHALDRLIELAVTRQYFRELLVDMGAVDALQVLYADVSSWNGYDHILANSSRRALISLSDVTINSAAQQLYGNDSGASSDRTSSQLSVLLEHSR